MKQLEKFRDPLSAAPKVALENEHVRVLDINIRPGEKVPMHSHPAYINVVLDNTCKVEFTMPDGRAHTEELKPGDVTWRDAEAHEGKNVGAAKCHLLVIEMKALAEAK